MTSDWLTPNSFRRLLQRAVLIPLGMLLGLAIVFLVQIVYLVSVMRWIDHTDRVIAESNELMTLFLEGETGMRGYLITGDELFLTPYHVQEKEVDQAFDDLIELVSDNPPQVERLKQIRNEHFAWRTYVQKTIEMRNQSAELEVSRSRRAKQHMDALREQIAAFIQTEEGLRGARIAAAERATWVTVATSLALTLALGAALGALTYRQLRQVSGQYGEALGKVEAQAQSLHRSVLRLESLHLIDRSILAAESVAQIAGGALHRMNPVVPAQDAFVALFGPDDRPAQVITRTSQLIPMSKLDPRRSDIVAATLDGNAKGSQITVPLQVDQRRIGLLILVNSTPFTEEHRQIAREVGSQLAITYQQAQMREQLRQHAANLEQRVKERTRELEEALENVRKLEGLVPICAWCKKVRDDNDYWHEVERYIMDHTDARFSHGICPACFEANLKVINQMKEKSGAANGKAGASPIA